MDITIVGDASAGDSVGEEIRQQLHAVAHSGPLSGRVRFTGFLPPSKTRAIVKEHNIFLCPSKHSGDGDAEGGSPVALTEAMAMGLLCLGSRHCDIPQVILDDKTGYLFQENDINFMADILCRVSAAQVRIAEVTDAGRRHIERKFSLAMQLDRLQQTYESLRTNNN